MALLLHLPRYERCTSPRRLSSLPRRSFRTATSDSAASGWSRARLQCTLWPSLAGFRC